MVDKKKDYKDVKNFRVNKNNQTDKQLKNSIENNSTSFLPSSKLQTQKAADKKSNLLSFNKKSPMQSVNQKKQYKDEKTEFKSRNPKPVMSILVNHNKSDKLKTDNKQPASKHLGQLKSVPKQNQNEFNAIKKQLVVNYQKNENNKFPKNNKTSLPQYQKKFGTEQYNKSNKQYWVEGKGDTKSLHNKQQRFGNKKENYKQNQKNPNFTKQPMHSNKKEFTQSKNKLLVITDSNNQQAIIQHQKFDKKKEDSILNNNKSILTQKTKKLPLSQKKFKQSGKRQMSRHKKIIKQANLIFTQQNEETVPGFSHQPYWKYANDFKLWTNIILNKKPQQKPKYTPNKKWLPRRQYWASIAKQDQIRHLIRKRWKYVRKNCVSFTRTNKLVSALVIRSKTRLKITHELHSSIKRFKITHTANWCNNNTNQKLNGLVFNHIVFNPYLQKKWLETSVIRKQSLTTYDKVFYYYTMQTPLTMYAHKAFILLEMQLNATIVRAKLVPYLFMVRDLCFYRIVQLNLQVAKNPHQVVSLYDFISIPVYLHNYMYYRQYRIQYYPKLIRAFFRNYWASFTNYANNKIWLLSNFITSDLTAEAVIFDYPNIVLYMGPFKRFTRLYYKNHPLGPTGEKRFWSNTHTILKIKLFQFASFYR